jgi:hypothetical protein
MKFKVLLQRGAVVAGDIIEYYDGSNFLLLRILRIGHPGRIYFAFMEDKKSDWDFTTVGGRAYFENPSDIVAALRARFGGNNTETAWNSLVLWRNGTAVGTLNQVREDLRLAGGPVVTERGEGSGSRGGQPAKKKAKLSEDEILERNPNDQDAIAQQILANHPVREGDRDGDGEGEYVGKGKGKKRVRDEEEDEEEEDDEDDDDEVYHGSGDDDDDDEEEND